MLSGSMPTPSPEPQRAPGRASCCPDRTVSSRGRSITAAIASMPLTTRLMITCCSWMRSPNTAGSAGARSRRSDTRCVSTSRCKSGMTSLMTSLTSSATFCVSVFLESARTRRMISLARLPLLIVSPTPLAPRQGPHGLVEQAQADLPVGDDGGKRLVHFVRDRRRKLAKRRHAGDVGELRLRLVQSHLRELGRGHVCHRAESQSTSRCIGVGANGACTYFTEPSGITSRYSL